MEFERVRKELGELGLWRRWEKRWNGGWKRRERS